MRIDRVTEALSPHIGRFRKLVLSKLLPLGGVSHDNQLQVFFDGDSAYSCMFDAIKKARKEVLMETYTLAPDFLGHTLVRELTAARRRGCKVLLIYDEFGSSGAAVSHLDEPLTAAGGVSMAFNSIWTWPWKIRHSLFDRNHRKILVVDNEVGFVGGMNVTEEYVGEKFNGTGVFRDTHLKVTGDAVNDLRKVVVDTYEYMCGKDVIDSPNTSALEEESHANFANTNEQRGTVAPVSSSPIVQILESNSIRKKSHIQRAMRIALREASHNCYVTTPYFIPPLRLRRALEKAARRGVDVRVLTAGKTDVKFAQFAANHNMRKILRAGVKVYQLSTQQLHAKTVVIDGAYSSVGSFNWDYFSFYRNLEVNLTTTDASLANALQKQFMIDIDNAVQVKIADLEKRNIFTRMLHTLAYYGVRFWKYLQ